MGRQHQAQSSDNPFTTFQSSSMDEIVVNFEGRRCNYHYNFKDNSAEANKAKVDLTMECLKVFVDLQTLSKTLDIPILSHAFKRFSPQESICFQTVIKNLHLQEYEVSDYRTAYHLLCDWIYGWSVSDSDYSHVSMPPSISGVDLVDSLFIQRHPRTINLKEDVEQQEADKIMKTFQTVFAIHRRALKKILIQLDEKTDKLNAGTSISFSTNSARGAFESLGSHAKSFGDTSNLPSTAENASATATTTASAPLTPPAQSRTTQPPHNANPKIPPMTLSLAVTVQNNINTMYAELDHSADMTILCMSAATVILALSESIKDAPTFLRYSMIIHEMASDFVGSNVKLIWELLNKELGNTGGLLHFIQQGYGKHSPASALRPISNSKSSDPLAPLKAPNFASTLEVPAPPGTRRGPIALLPIKSAPSAKENWAAPFSHSQLPLIPPEKPKATSLLPGTADSKRLSESEIRKTVDTSFTPGFGTEILIADIRDLDKFKTVAEKLLVIKAQVCTNLALETFAKTGTVGESISAETTLSAAVPSDAGSIATASQITPQSQLKQLKAKTRLGFIILGVVSDHFTGKLQHKLALIHQLFTNIDVFIFPKFVTAHKDGVKAMQYSIFGSNLWLTGGYDCMVKIFDMKTRTCLAQYVGHRSIVTDVHFSKDDSLILSSSFDRTLKIWDSQTGACEKTLHGHTDSIMSSDWSPDGRLIVSASADLSFKLWDASSGECLLTVRKHSRWVKVVRFSKDGKYLLSVGLDKRVYVWDVRVLLTSRAEKDRNVTTTTTLPHSNHPIDPHGALASVAIANHLRYIEAHDDYILAVALTIHQPTLLITSSRDQKVKLWNFVTGALHNEVNLAPSWACTVAISHDGMIFATGSFDNNITLFKIDTVEKIRQLRVFNLGILSLAFPDNYEYLVCGTSEGYLQQIAL